MEMSLMNTKKSTTRACLALAGLGLVLSGCHSSVKQAASTAPHEYLLTVTRPNQLQVIDTETNRISRSCEIPGYFGSGSIATSPNGRIAYVLSNKWEDIYGFDITDCKMVFSAKQSTEKVTVKTFFSLTLSPDGKELYTIQNPVGKLPDRYQVMQPQLAVFDTSAGFDVQPSRRWPVDRRITKIATLDSGEVVLGGADLKAIDPQNGKVRVISKLQNWERGPRWLTPDAFAVSSQGEHVGEYIMPYVTAEFKDDSMNFETADWWWGMSRVDLSTGEVEQLETVPFQFIVFSWVSDPHDANIIYGAFNTLSKHDIKQKKTLAVTDMDHTYYTINMTSDGGTLYVGGTSSDISVHDPATLEKKGSIQLPGDMSTADMRLARLQE
jgi:quinohemoprotein amine dehydrogenase beta subunit